LEVWNLGRTLEGLVFLTKLAKVSGSMCHGNQVIQVAGAHICNTRVLAKIKTSNKKITTSAVEEGAQWPKALQAFDLLAASQVPRNAPWTNARIFGWGWLRHQNQGMWAA